MKTDILPTHASDWQGKPQRIPYPPKSSLIARCESVTVWRSKSRFSVVYGLQVKTFTEAFDAFGDFASCCQHQATCEGLLD